MLINNESVERDGDNMNEPIIQVEGICKSFSMVKVLENISFSIRPGQVLALIGKMAPARAHYVKSLPEAIPRTRAGFGLGRNGILTLRLKRQKNWDKNGPPGAADPSQLSIMENIFVGNELVKNGLIDKKQMYIRAKELLGEVGLECGSVYPG